MARQFSPYSIYVPSSTTHEESWALQDADGVAISLAGYKARMQIRKSPLDLVPIIEYTSPGFYGVTPPQLPVPAWPYFEVFNALDSTGLITLTVPTATYASLMLAAGVKKAKYYYDVLLVIPGTPPYVVPLFSDRIAYALGVTR